MARTVATVLLLTFLLAGCAGGNEDTDSTSSTTTSKAATVSASVSVTSTGPASSNATEHKQITDNEFVNGTFEIQRGTTVVWTNMGQNPHSVTSEAAGFDGPSVACTPTTTEACLQNGDEYSHTFNVVGTFPYHCKIHSSMSGTITVTQP